MGIFDLEHLEDVNEGNLVVGGDEPLAQFVGGSTGVGVGFATGGSVQVQSSSDSRLDGNVGGPGRFLVFFGSTVQGFTFPS